VLFFASAHHLLTLSLNLLFNSLFFLFMALLQLLDLLYFLTLVESTDFFDSVLIVVSVDDGLGKVHHLLHVRVIVVYLGNQIDLRWVNPRVWVDPN